MQQESDSAGLFTVDFQGPSPLSYQQPTAQEAAPAPVCTGSSLVVLRLLVHKRQQRLTADDPLHRLGLSCPFFQLLTPVASQKRPAERKRRFSMAFLLAVPRLRVDKHRGLWQRERLPHHGTVSGPIRGERGPYVGNGQNGASTQSRVSGTQRLTPGGRRKRRPTITMLQESIDCLETGGLFGYLNPQDFRLSEEICSPGWPDGCPPTWRLT